jgi:hypothetical protein
MLPCSATPGRKPEQWALAATTSNPKFQPAGGTIPNSAAATRTWSLKTRVCMSIHLGLDYYNRYIDSTHTELRRGSSASTAVCRYLWACSTQSSSAARGCRLIIKVLQSVAPTSSSSRGSGWLRRRITSGASKQRWYGSPRWLGLEFSRAKQARLDSFELVKTTS